ncbi:MAG: hypothetical protein IJ247_02425 [Bacilli bacterium]|nr:hypothetical protein [Bacilli bacterium]
MKRKLLLVASLFLTLGVSGCSGPKSEPKNDDLSDNPSMPSYEPGSDSTNKSTIDDPTANKETLKSEEEIKTAIGDIFKISADSLPSGAPSTSASDGTYHYYSSLVRTGFYKKIGDKFYQYTKQGGSAKYNRLADPATGLNVIGRDNVGGLFMYAGCEISYKSKENVTFLNRQCTKYSYQGDSALGYNQSYTEEIIIDNATGACFKHEAHGVATDGFTGSGAKENFQITEFVLGNDAQTYVNSLLNNVDVYEWDTAFLTQIGLNDVSQPNFELFESEWDDSERTDEEALWHVQYLNRVNKEDGVDAVKNIMEAFYNGGAKLDEDGNVISSYDVAPIYYDNLEDNDSLYFSAHIQSHPTSGVRINADYINATHYWRIDFDIGYID